MLTFLKAFSCLISVGLFLLAVMGAGLGLIPVAVGAVCAVVGVSVILAMGEI